VLLEGEQILPGLRRGYPHADCDTREHTNGNTDGHGHGRRNTHSHTNRHGHWNTHDHANGDSNRHSHRNSNGNADRNGHRDAYAGNLLTRGRLLQEKRELLFEPMFGARRQ
jgi:hypothetical protein